MNYVLDIEPIHKRNRMDTVFKDCGACGCVWETRHGFIMDSSITLVGYQPDFRELTAGIFLFNHQCGNTLAIEALAFKDLYQGPIFVENLRQSETCPGYCLHQENLDPCPNQCECAYVRDIIQLLGRRR